ncbi:hypothetical protein KJ641_00380 [Patescibacteria group bacterium]|nr:hypothetical protein [Patescibacteria group bacterium]MBU1895315.1 hypothetical protein [Patescibacteria group bacterium]
MAETGAAPQKNTTGKVKSVLSDALFKYTLGMGFLPSEQDKLKETLDNIGDEFGKLFDKTVDDITTKSIPETNGETKAEPTLDNWPSDATAQEGEIYKPFDDKLDQIVAENQEPEQEGGASNESTPTVPTTPTENTPEESKGEDFKPYGAESEAGKGASDQDPTKQETPPEEAGQDENAQNVSQSEEPKEEDVQALSRKKRKRVESLQKNTQKITSKIQNELNKEIRPYQKEISKENRKKLPLTIQKRILQAALLAARLTFLIVLIIAIIIILLGFILTIIIITAVIGVPMMGSGATAIGYSAKTYKKIAGRLKKMIKKIDKKIKEIDKKIKNLQGIIMTLQRTANSKIATIQGETNREIQQIMQS